MNQTAQIKHAEKVMEDVRKKLASWNERSQFTMKGVKNLSRSDMDSITMYAEAIIRNGNYNCYMAPRGEVRDVLAAYGLAEKEVEY
jgi:hypothetical protein